MLGPLLPLLFGILSETSFPRPLQTRTLVSFAPCRRFPPAFFRCFFPPLSNRTRWDIHLELRESRVPPPFSLDPYQDLVAVTSLLVFDALHLISKSRLRNTETRSTSEDYVSQFDLYR